MGQFILGKTETGFSALIKFKVTKKLKTDYSLETNRFKLQFKYNNAHDKRGLNN